MRWTFFTAYLYTIGSKGSHISTNLYPPFENPSWLGCVCAYVIKGHQSLEVEKNEPSVPIQLLSCLNNCRWRQLKRYRVLQPSLPRPSLFFSRLMEVCMSIHTRVVERTWPCLNFFSIQRKWRKLCNLSDPYISGNWFGWIMMES